MKNTNTNLYHMCLILLFNVLIEIVSARYDFIVNSHCLIQFLCLNEIDTISFMQIYTIYSFM